MIKKNKLYYYDYYCEDSGLYSVQIVLSLHDEEEVGYDTYTDYTYDGCLYDLVEVLVDNKIKPVLTIDLIEIEEK